LKLDTNLNRSNDKRDDYLRYNDDGVADFADEVSRINVIIDEPDNKPKAFQLDQMKMFSGKEERAPLSQSPFLDNIYGRREDLPRRSSLGTKSKRQSGHNNSLYQYIDNKYQIIMRGATADSRLSDYTPTKASSEVKSKGFKLKPKKPEGTPFEEQDQKQIKTKRDLVQSDKIPLELQQFSFVDKIRRTF
jgi:hypothetical protein